MTKITKLSPLIIILLALSFIIPLSMTSGVVANPQIIFEVANTCAGGASCAILVNAFDPSLNTGNTVILVSACYPSNAAVTSTTDTISTVYTSIIGFKLISGNQPIGTLANNALITIIFGIIPTTASHSFTITVHFSPNSTACQFGVYLGTEGMAATQSAASPFVSRTTSLLGFGCPSNNNYKLLTQTYNTPPQALPFIVDAINDSSGDNSAFSSHSGLTPLRTDSVATLHATTLFNTFYQFVSNKASQSYSSDLRIPIQPCNFQYSGAVVSVVFTSLIPPGTTCQAVTCNVGGGGSSISSSTTSLTANTTYYYVMSSGSGGVNVQNITTKIHDYTNANSGKALDTYVLGIYQQVASTPSLNLPISSVYPLFSGQLYFLNIRTGLTNQWGHAGTNTTLPNIPIPPNTQFAVSIMSKFTGLTVYQTVDTTPLYSSPEGIFTPSIWAPPTTISVQTTTTPPIFLLWSGIEKPLILNVTSTSTSISTCNGCATSTVTTSITTTSLTYQSATNATRISTIQDIETFFPVWIMPLIFSPFGIQGIILGLVFGSIIGGVMGIIPLWMAFLITLVLGYLLLRRF